MRISSPGTGVPRYGRRRTRNAKSSGSSTTIGFATRSRSSTIRSTVSHTSPRPRSGNDPPIATSAIPNAGNTPPASNPWGSAAATNASTATGSTGSAPESARVSDDRSRSFARRRARVASTQAKFGPAVAVPRCAEIHSIQLPGWAMKSCGAACTSDTPDVIGIARKPTRPMSW